MLYLHKPPWATVLPFPSQPVHISVFSFQSLEARLQLHRIFNNFPMNAYVCLLAGIWAVYPLVGLFFLNVAMAIERNAKQQQKLCINVKKVNGQVLNIYLANM